MKFVKSRLKITLFFIIALLCCIFAAGVCRSVSVAAEGVSDWEDGTYSVTYEVGGTSAIGKSMIANYFDDTVMVDKVGDNYYMSLSLVKSVSSMQNLTLTLDSNTDGKQIGQEITEDTDSRKTYRYTLSAENLASTLNYSVYISAMGTTQSFTITLNLDSATYVGEADTIADRPAEFVPTITTSAGSEYQVQTGASFAIPSATATLGAESCDVTYTVYYAATNGNESVELNGSSFVAENTGEYYLIYRAESSTYKTMLGNDTYSEYEVVITSTAAATSVAYFEDADGVLTDSAVMQASAVTSGAVYDMAADRMADISDNYEVYSVLIYNGAEEADLSGEIGIYIATTLNTSKAVVYYMDAEGNLTKLSSSPADGYVKVTTDKTGTFIVCIPGVAMSKMTKMIILAAVLLVVVIAVAITIPVVIHKKRKKKRLSGK
ncbi:MAG: NEAT domain-containing protein [Clostridia bacterium]|nr:NEAT domain-containing protein [Clostridia bacterium]